jgi:hypothetical protein
MTEKYLPPMVHIRKFSLMAILLVLLWGPSIGQDDPGDPGTYRAGEKSFQELVNADGLSCVDCHYFSEQDTINWNPSAMDLAYRAGIYKAEGIGLYFSDPKGEVLKKAHAGISLSAEQQSELISYLDHLQANPFISSAPLRWKMILFVGMFVFLILLRIEKNRLGKLPGLARRILGLAAWGVIAVIIVQDALGFNLSRNYAPVQPIKFSHTIHATDNKIECNYCHPGVLKGKNAGVPHVSLCMNCHKHQQEGTRTGRFEIRKVLQAAEDSVAIRWVRIHSLPDFTYFNHMQHVTIGGVECITCHGEVENMHIVKQVEDLSMGWCIKCHDETKVDFSNDYYKTYYPALNDSLLTGRIDSIMVSDINGRECSVCHY